MNIPDRGEGRNKQEIQYVYRGRKGTGEDYSMHKKKGLTKQLQLSDWVKVEKVDCGSGFLLRFFK